MHPYYLKTLKTLIPRLIALALIMVSMIPLKITGLSSFIIAFEQVLVFYWSIYLPKLFPRWFIIVIGLFQDLIYGLPLGLSAIINIISQSMIISQRKIFLKEPFFVVWLGFCIFSFCVTLIKWVLTMAVFSATFSPMNSIMQWLLTSSCYPIMHVFFTSLYAKLPISQENA